MVICHVHYVLKGGSRAQGRLWFSYIFLYVASRLKAIVIIFSFFTCCFHGEKYIFTQVTNWTFLCGRDKCVTSQGEHGA